MAIAKFPTVSKFFCYFELSTGGLVLGWFNAVVYGLVLAVLIINVLSGMSIIDSERLNKFTVLGEKLSALIKDSSITCSISFL